MAMNEDFSAFFNTDEHASSAVYRSLPIEGVFEDQYVEVNGVESVKPTFLINVDAVPGVKRGNPIFIENIEYKIVAFQYDGTGLVLLILEAIV